MSGVSRLVSFSFTSRALQVLSVKSTDPSKLSQDNFLSATVSVRGATFLDRTEVTTGPYNRQGKIESLEQRLRFFNELASQDSLVPWTMQIQVQDPEDFQLGLDIQEKQGSSMQTVRVLKEFTFCEIPDKGDLEELAFTVDRVVTCASLEKAAELTLQKLQSAQLLFDGNEDAFKEAGGEVQKAVVAYNRAARFLKKSTEAVEEVAREAKQGPENEVGKEHWEYGMFTVTRKG